MISAAAPEAVTEDPRFEFASVVLIDDLQRVHVGVLLPRTKPLTCSARYNSSPAMVPLSWV